MVSLAPFRYRSVLAEAGGPIDRIDFSEFPVLGRRLFQANARLKHNLVPRRSRQIYSDADGTGTHASPMIARHMAVSESLERWAFHATVRSARRAEFGFDVDESTNGMAAFPGIFRGQARRGAMLEASERFCLLNWWERRMDGRCRATQWPAVQAIELDPPAGGSAVILHSRSDWGFHVYGHAAGESFEDACGRALLELTRHELVMRHHMLSGTQGAPRDLLERRACYFASDEGYALFQERVAARADGPPPDTTVACDAEIDGPWSTYATVWRFVFRPPSRRFLSDDERYFFW